MRPKTIVTDAYDFPTLIRDGNVYVGKTAYLHRLVSKAVCVFEFKYGKTVKAALRQIDENGYALPYAADHLKVICIGLNYNAKAASLDVPLGMER